MAAAIKILNSIAECYEHVNRILPRYEILFKNTEDKVIAQWCPYGLFGGVMVTEKTSYKFRHIKHYWSNKDWKGNSMLKEYKATRYIKKGVIKVNDTITNTVYAERDNSIYDLILLNTDYIQSVISQKTEDNAIYEDKTPFMPYIYYRVTMKNGNVFDVDYFNI